MEMTEKHGWKLYAVRKFCSSDDWRSSGDESPGAWDEVSGSEYVYEHRCSKCENTMENNTPYCPYCGTKMMYFETITRENW